jgi:hypothetical protein
LRIGNAEWSREDFRVGGSVEPWVEFADALSCFEVVGGMGFAQILGLVLEVVETGINREVSHRHDELPFVCPGPHVEG